VKVIVFGRADFYLFSDSVMKLFPRDRIKVLEAVDFVIHGSCWQPELCDSYLDARAPNPHNPQFHAFHMAVKDGLLAQKTLAGVWDHFGTYAENQVSSALQISKTRIRNSILKATDTPYAFVQKKIQKALYRRDNAREA
jgi:hypothetical protein